MLRLYSIVDIEATGGNSKIGRITEISILKFDGQKIVDEFTSLINPERPIPPFVQKLTGISDQMAADSPKFRDVAKDVKNILAGSCFVAHNVKFDYSFFHEEFKLLGLDFHMDKLCTLQYSQKVWPEIGTYGLSKLCKAKGIQNGDRHRAKGDALATVELFKMLLAEDKNQYIKRLIKNS